MALVDLNAELLRIRDARSRQYFADALKSYNAGALRAAIAATWVAVVFDLVRKYRELASTGDQAAVQYIAGWDSAIAHNNTAALLALERDLLDHASTTMSLIDAMGHTSLERLHRDRHLCAHPAFNSDDSLFEPIEELVRTHMVNAIELVLAQPPIRGRQIFEAFSTDIQSPGFPATQAVIIDYVEQKYLNRMRSNVVPNFGIVLSKSLIRDIPPVWQPFRSKVANCLLAVQRRRPAAWPDIQTTLTNFINEDNPAHRSRVFRALAKFPNLIPLIDNAVVVALTQMAQTEPNLQNYPEVFFGLELDQFRDMLIGRVAQLDDGAAAAVIAAVPAPHLWPDAVRRYGQSGSYRGAEQNFVLFIAPFASGFTQDQFDDLFAIVSGNGQIWNASATPSQITSIFAQNADLRPSDEGIWHFLKSQTLRNDPNYAGIWTALLARGWVRPSPQYIEERLEREEQEYFAANQ